MINAGKKEFGRHGRDTRATTMKIGTVSRHLAGSSRGKLGTVPSRPCGTCLGQSLIFQRAGKMPALPGNCSRFQRGFTLAELIVASTLLSIIMVGVYSAFYSSIRAWRAGEADIEAYQDARSALGIISRELRCVAGGSANWFQGKDDQLEFYTVSPALNLKDGQLPHVLKAEYRLRQNPHGKNKILVREEARVKGPFPIPSDPNKPRRMPRIKLGRKYKFDLATDVKDFKIEYIWVPSLPPRKPGTPPPPGPPRQIIEKANHEGWGLPQGVKVTLVVADTRSPDGKTEFSEYVAFRCETTRLAHWMNSPRDRFP